VLIVLSNEVSERNLNSVYEHFVVLAPGTLILESNPVAGECCFTHHSTGFLVPLRFSGDPHWRGCCWSGMAPVFLSAGAKAKWEPGLISQDLRRQHSREAHAFTLIVHQKRTGEFENCAKLLKTTVGEEPEWFNGSVC
jgi:hypothetical protein